MKPTLMIHEINPNIIQFLKENGENYLLTFDDGLYSQYFYFDEIKKINTEKIFFISTGTVHKGKQQIVNISCRNAHKLFFENGYTHYYMTWDQIKEIDSIDNCFIGGHSHSHFNTEKLSLKEKIEWLTNDTEKMIEEFNKNFGKIPKYYCLPYNYDYQGLYSSLLEKNYNFEIFGKNRIKIEEII